MKRLIHPKLLIACLFCAGATMSASAQSEFAPRPSIEEMCQQADLIVEGEHVGDGWVRISHVFYPGHAKVLVDGDITVPAILEHERRPAPSLVVENNEIKCVYEKGEIKTQRLILFLKVGRDRSLVPIGLDGCGSEGLFWCFDERCYGYARSLFEWMPLELYKSNASRTELWRRIESGLHARKLKAEKG